MDVDEGAPKPRADNDDLSKYNLDDYDNENTQAGGMTTRIYPRYRLTTTRASTFQQYQRTGTPQEQRRGSLCNVEGLQADPRVFTSSYSGIGRRC